MSTKKSAIPKQKKSNKLGYFTPKEILLDNLWKADNKKVIDGKWYVPLPTVIKLLEDI